MAEINNSELIDEVVKTSGIQTVQGIPRQLGNQIIPVLDVTSKNVKIAQEVHEENAKNASFATLFTTPTDKDFYLTGCTLAVIKDATSTSTKSRLQIHPEEKGETNILSIAGLTLTAQSETISLNLRNPVKIKRGTNIRVYNATSVANINATATIVGFTLEAI